MKNACRKAGADPAAKQTMNRKFLGRLARVSVSLAVFSSPLADEAFATDELLQYSRYDDARAVAMGNAYMGFADEGAAALFYNPAGIGKIRGLRGEFLNLNLQMNSGFMGNFGPDFYNFGDLDTWKDKVAAGAPLIDNGGAFQLAPSISFRGLAIGLLYKENYSATLEEDGTTIAYGGHAELVPAIGTAVRLASGVIRLGYVAQYVQKARGTGRAPASTSGLSYKDGIPEGAGISHNVGASLTLPLSFLPTFNVVGRNLFGLTFGKSFLPLTDGSGGLPATEPMVWDAGFSAEFKLGGGNAMFASLEYRDVLGASAASLPGRIAFGTEVSFWRSVYLRAGLGSGYPSLGLGFDLKRSRVSLSWYSEERGDAFWAERDQRYALQLQLKSF
jgi:hypothetical protein